MPVRHSTAWARTSLFARSFIQHPKMVGSLIPSSPFLVRCMMRAVPWKQARVLVEYGPGTGEFTTAILARMRPDAVLVAIELNPEFVSFLRQTIHDPRLVLVTGSAADVESILADLHLGPPDCIVSALPYTNMPPAVRRAIFAATRQVLPAGGRFLVLQFSPLMQGELSRVFPRMKRTIEPRNLPPAFVYTFLR
jgi:phospholipid N-methyltransferase